MKTYDLIIAGGGLSGGLLAYALSVKRPDLNVLLLEKNARLGGNHTWSFHDSDIPRHSWNWLTPLISCSWPEHEVHFPGFSRVLKCGYNSILSEGFDTRVRAKLGANVWTDAHVEEIGATEVRLKDGVKLTAKAVVDARGLMLDAHKGPVQKFIGLNLRLSEPHNLKRPVLMDARVEQKEGFRFFYVLPWTAYSLLIEDTRYSESQSLDESAMREEIVKYAEGRGWSVSRIERAERGVLPIPLLGQPAADSSIGTRGDFMHATTGYSLPDNVRVSEVIATLDEITPHTLARALKNYARKKRWQWRYQRALNRMLFHAAEPASRYRVLEHFYRLPTTTIKRFYRSELKVADYIRILAGKPPVPVFQGLKALVTFTPRGRHEG